MVKETQYNRLLAHILCWNRSGKQLNSGSIFKTNLYLSIKICMEADMKFLDKGTSSVYITNSFIISSPILIDLTVSLYLTSWQLSHISSSWVYLQKKLVRTTLIKLEHNQNWEQETKRNGIKKRLDGFFRISKVHISKVQISKVWISKVQISNVRISRVQI